MCVRCTFCNGIGRKHGIDQRRWLCQAAPRTPGSRRHFVGPLPTSLNRYILNYISKFAEVVPLSSKNADGASAALCKIFMRMGIPRVLTSDNGGEFRNELDGQLAKALGIKRIFTTPYHPQLRKVTIVAQEKRERLLAAKNNLK
ncbi:hypothetical protein EMCRGX_G015123 [Ephydatia muelleri]